MEAKLVKLVECPRDAMQGLPDFVPTELKIRYLNTLLNVGFHTLDFGSFVSPKAIPQMKDTAEVLSKLDLSSTSTKLLSIVANLRGAQDALKFQEIDYLGFPLSISETFQQRNTNSSITEAFFVLEKIQQEAIKHNRSVVVYVSMGFGNPYSDQFNDEIVHAFVKKLNGIGISIICPSDTIGVSTPKAITSLFSSLLVDFPAIEFGAHLHARPNDGLAKIEAVLSIGVSRIDGAIRGFGGCPLAADSLVGNIATESIVDYLDNNNVNLFLNKEEWTKAVTLSHSIFH